MKKNEQSPPSLFLRFFRWFCDPKLMQYIEGDLLELYQERVHATGKRRADMQFMIDVLLLFRPGIIRSRKRNNHVKTNFMFRSYFKIGWRKLLQNKAFSFINIGGLSIGLAIAVLIPNNPPWRLTRAPPLLPGLMAASV